MKIVSVTGARGRLGSYLISKYPRNFIPLDCDVTRTDSVQRAFEFTNPDAVLHLAAKSDVDWCEDPKNEKALFSVNVRGTFNVCSAAEAFGADVCLLSSDHVFNGRRGSYKESDKTGPINAYGFSKLGAEALQTPFSNLKVVRTSYMFDAERLSRLGDGEYPTFISRSFISVEHMAQLLLHYFEYMDKMPKILNLSGSEIVSWYGFAYALGLNVTPRTHEIRNEMAPRPHKGGLNVSLSRRLGFPQFNFLDGIKK